MCIVAIRSFVKLIVKVTAFFEATASPPGRTTPRTAAISYWTGESNVSYLTQNKELRSESHEYGVLDGSSFDPVVSTAWSMTSVSISINLK